MNLFELKGSDVIFSPQALELAPFKALWDRDTTPDKSRARQELAFVWFFSDFKSDFSDLLDDEERRKAIIEVIPIVPDDLVEQAISFYEERQSTINTEMLKSAKGAAKKIKDYYDSVDFSLVTPRGQPVFDIKKVQDSLRTLKDTIVGLDELQTQVQKELESKGNMKGNRSKRLMEDGL